MSTPSLLSGRVAFITGGGTGVGFTIASAFATNGAKVYISGRRLEVLQKAAASLKYLNGSIVAIKMDAIDEASVREAADVIRKADGKLDILVNNAGISGPIIGNDEFIAKKMASSDPFEPESFKNWQDTFSLNTIAPFFIIRAFSELLLDGARARGEQATSSVINISSAAAAMKLSASAASFAYSSTKVALDHLTVALATSFAMRGMPIRVNAIQPGAFMSELAVQVGLPDSVKSDPMPGFIAVAPAKRLGTSEEMASTALYLATTDYVNGVIVRVDGGVSLVNP